MKYGGQDGESKLEKSCTSKLSDRPVPKPLKSPNRDFAKSPRCRTFTKWTESACMSSNSYFASKSWDTPDATAVTQGGCEDSSRGNSRCTSHRILFNNVSVGPCWLALADILAASLLVSTGKSLPNSFRHKDQTAAQLVCCSYRHWAYHLRIIPDELRRVWLADVFGLLWTQEGIICNLADQLLWNARQLHEQADTSACWPIAALYSSAS